MQQEEEEEEEEDEVSCGKQWAELDSMQPEALACVDRRQQQLNASGLAGYSLLNTSAAAELMAAYNRALNAVRLRFKYEVYDIVVADNLAVAHRAASSAHDPAAGLRVLHRTTVRGTTKLDPPASSGLPPFLYIWGDRPFSSGGVWHPLDQHGVGFRWDEAIHMQN